MENTQIYLAYHAPTIENGKVTVPASLISITQVNETDCFGTPIVARLSQRYARPNKKFTGGIVTVDMFKGKHGIEEVFYSENEIVEYLKMITNDGYVTKRATSQNENELADNIFKVIYSYNLELARNSGKFKLPS